MRQHEMIFRPAPVGATPPTQTQKPSPRPDPKPAPPITDYASI